MTDLHPVFGAEGDERPAAARPPQRWWRRHKALSVLLGVALVLLLTTAGWVVHLNRQIGDIPRFQVAIPEAERPVRDEDGGENILLLGADDGGDGLFGMLESGEWQSGAFRSDAIMVMHLSSDRERAQVVSIPRDSFVPIEGHGSSKINAAFSWGGPALMTQTVEQLTEIRIDHVVVIDFAHFEQLTDSVGGVTIAGQGTMQGTEALEYVRARKSLPNGDFDRVQRHQNFLRALMHELVSTGVVANPARLTRVVTELADTVAVDDSLTSSRIRSLALSSRGLRPGDVRFVTVPTLGTADHPEAGSIVRLDRNAVRDMFEAVAKDEFESWYGDHDVDELPEERLVD